VIKRTGTTAVVGFFNRKKRADLFPLFWSYTKELFFQVSVFLVMNIWWKGQQKTEEHNYFFPKEW